MHRSAYAVAVLALLYGGAGPAAAQPPHLDYLQFCEGCHREDGSGSARNGVPDMRGVIGRLASVPSGRAFMIQVAGVAQTPLSDDALARLMNWLIPRMDASAPAADFPPYTATEVAALRADRPADLPALRAQAVAELTLEEARAATTP